MFTLFQSLRLTVDHIDDSPSFSPQQYQTHQDATSHNTHKHPSSYCPTICSVSIDPLFCMAPECTAISLAVARFTNVTAARAREAREMYPVSTVSFGAELGRPSIRLMFNSSHDVTKGFPSRCFVIKSAGLTLPRIFCGIDSASNLLDPELPVVLFLLQPKVLRLHVFDCAAPASESQSACSCICTDSHLSFVSKVSYRVGQSDSLSLQSVPRCSILTPRCSVTSLSVSTTKLPRCVDQHASSLQMSSVSSSVNQQRQHRTVHRSARCSLLVAAGTPTRHVACRVGTVRYVSDE